MEQTSRQTKIHNIGGKVVGVDKFGNKYYENLNTQYGRHRWVEYAEKGRYNASQVPPEWHGWLHYITDHTGDEARSFSYSICTSKTFQERVMSIFTIPRDMPSIQGRETGPGTNHGNPPSPKTFLQHNTET
uniref:NADH dehydrogenase [ubiquinone] 1 alpha subcomplex subunit 12 n=1 Tax=Fagus sylvatica TaxID=28930 RepID=A0A2N9J5E6_FAGSY